MIIFNQSDSFGDRKFSLKFHEWNGVWWPGNQRLNVFDERKHVHQLICWLCSLMKNWIFKFIMKSLNLLEWSKER